MNHLRTLCTGAALGAGMMYLFDPREGKRRRVLFFDRLHRVARETAEGLDVATRDLQNRARGTAAEVGALLSAEQASDAVIAQRVRSKAGRYLAHPSALEVDVSGGNVVLRGPVLCGEAEALASAVRWVRGVSSVDNQLEVHDLPDIPALQGEGRHRSAVRQGRQSNWSPAARLIAGSIGSVLLLSSLTRRSSGMLCGLAGLGLLARASGNLDLGRTFGVSGGHRAIDVRKTIEMDVPIERAFDFFADPTNYARISDSVTDVQILGAGHFVKEMTFGGVSMRFEERVTRSDFPEILDSRSEPGSMVSFMKQFHFERAGDNRTRVHVLFSYNPLGGVLAHAAAGALGFDPKSVLDDLMMRAKSYLETGRELHDAAKHAPALAAASTPMAHSTAEIRSAAGRETAWPQPSGQVPPAV